MTVTSQVIVASSAPASSFRNLPSCDVLFGDSVDFGDDQMRANAVVRCDSCLPADLYGVVGSAWSKIHHYLNPLPEDLHK